MKTDNNYEKKYTSKLYRLFDLLYKLLVINLFTIILSLPVVTMFPAIVASSATIKNNLNETGIFKPYFRNFKKYFLKSLLIGLLLLVVFAIGTFGIMFWIFQDFGTNKTMEVIAQIGIVVLVVCLIIMLFISVHLPLLIVTFEALSNTEILITSFYVTIRYFLTTLVLLFATLFSIGLLLACYALPGLLAVWMIFGISLPMFIAIKITTPVYYRFAKIDFIKMNEQIEEEINNEN